MKETVFGMQSRATMKKAFGSKQMDSLLEQAKAFAVSQRV